MACRSRRSSAASSSGVRKINIDTDIRLAMTGAMRQAFAKHPSEFDPRKALMAGQDAARGICKARFEAFGCAGHARASSRCRWKRWSRATLEIRQAFAAQGQSTRALASKAEPRWRNCSAFFSSMESRISLWQRSSV